MLAIRLSTLVLLLTAAPAFAGSPSRPLFFMASGDGLDSWLLGAVATCQAPQAVDPKWGPKRVQRFKNFCQFLSDNVGDPQTLAARLADDKTVQIPVFPGLTDAYVPRTNPGNPAEWLDLPGFAFYDQRWRLPAMPLSIPLSVSVIFHCAHNPLYRSDADAAIVFTRAGDVEVEAPAHLAFSYYGTLDTNGRTRLVYQGRALVLPGIHAVRLEGIAVEADSWFDTAVRPGPDGSPGWDYYVSPECRARRRVDFAGRPLPRPQRVIRAPMASDHSIEADGGRAVLLIRADFPDVGLGGAALAAPTPVCTEARCP